MHQYRLRSTKVTACRWHGDHRKRDAFKEIEETFGIKPHSGHIHRVINGKIGVSDGASSVDVRPGQWIIRGLMDGMIAMDDDLFQALFKEVVEKSSCDE